MLQIIIKVAAIIYITHGSYAHASIHGVQEFLHDNGQHNVDLVYNSSNWRGFSLRDIYVARIHMDNIRKAHKKSFGIFMYNGAKDDLLSYLTAIMQRQIKMSLLIISEPWGTEQLNLIKKHLYDLQATAFFYIAIPVSGKTEMTWHQIISVKSGSSITKLKFERNKSKIIEAYDLQGLQIRSTSLTWPPYLTIDDCNAEGKNCAKNYGFMIDFMDTIAIKYNFTYLSQKNLYNKWYEIGADGKNRGVWGEVISKDYDLSLSPWYWIISRDKMLDFVPFIQNRDILALGLQYSTIDFGLFTRAFVGDTWIALLCIVFAILIIFLFANIYGINEMMNGIQMMTFTSWLFFTLITSYYSGVLTMFFAAPALEPFETISDVIQAYPEWRLMFEEGNAKWI